MSDRPLPWFRFYSEAIDDEKLGLLAFEDRWHFVALLCLKCKGVLDSDADDELLRRKVALKLGLTCAELENVLRRLSKMGLIDFFTIQPIAWDDRQMQSDSSTARVQAFREKKKRTCNVSETAQEVEVDLDLEVEVDKELKTKSKTIAPSAPKFSAKQALIDLGVTEQVASDYLAIRKAKKSPLTETAIVGIQREANKAGIAFADAVGVSTENGWQGFKADWYQNLKPSTGMQTRESNRQAAYDEIFTPAIRQELTGQRNERSIN